MTGSTKKDALRLAQISRVESALDSADLEALTEAATASILDGGALDWTQPPERRVLERYFTGLPHVPGRELFIARRADGLVCGAGVLTLPGRSALISPRASLTGGFVAPYARGQGLGTALVQAMLKRAWSRGARVVNCELPETQKAAIHLMKRAGFTHWGTHPFYARLEGKSVRGLYFTMTSETDRKLVSTPPLRETRNVSPVFNNRLYNSGLNADLNKALGDDQASMDNLMSNSGTSPNGMTTSMTTETPASTKPLALYPAIDLKGGACVRLRQGEMSDATRYSDDPAAQARAFEEAGCRTLHVVDLDGAFAGQSANTEAVKEILAATSLPVQLGGGLRDMRAIERWIEAGVSRVILGSAAVKDPGLVRQAARAWPGRVVAGIDARNGRVATEGWAEISELTAPELALRMEDAGVAAVIFTEITRDGMLEGLDVAQTAALAQRISIPVIASGGVGTLAHLQELRKTAATVPGISGVVIGRALYDGRIALGEALQALAAPC